MPFKRLPAVTTFLCFSWFSGSVPTGPAPSRSRRVLKSVPSGFKTEETGAPTFQTSSTENRS